MSRSSGKEPVQAPVIAILSFNKVKLLRRCVESIMRNTGCDYTICVVDQASTDGTGNYLKKMGTSIERISPKKNLGFVEGNNRVMEQYADRDIVLLNNDTEVKKGWLKALIHRAYSDDSIGIVGSKLIYPDGKLQAAGCEMFSDASGREIGKFDDPDRWIYNQTTDADYCSGACLYLKRETLNKTGYFDMQFAPAYWEDNDLCFAAREAGFRVVYEPESVVVHHEGGSFGTTAARKSKSSELQATNKPKFMNKWKEQLKKQRENVFEIPSVEGKEKILVVMPFLPIYDKAAGEMRWFHTLKILQKKYQVVFLARNGQDGIKYINPLEELGITVFHTDQDRLRQLGCEMNGPLWIDFPQLLKSNDFKAVIVGFWHMASQYYSDIKQFAPRTKLIIDSFDVSFLREQRKAELSGKDSELWHAQEIKRIELSWYRKADMVLTVTEKDRDVLLKEDPSLTVGISTDIHPLPPFEWKNDRKDLVYIGNFQHNPNEDAVLYFTREVLPLIHKELPDVKFNIVGNAPTSRVKGLAGDKVNVTGFVPEITPWLQECAVCVVPLRFGAGLKGKVGQAMAAGAPQVSTSIGVEGMGMTHERDVLIADSPEDFAREVIRLYRDESLQKEYAENARNLVAKAYSSENAEKYWLEVYEHIDSDTLPRRETQQEEQPEEDKKKTGYNHLAAEPRIVPSVSIVVPVYNNLSFTVNCRASIQRNTRIPFELVIVDNGSTEPIALDAEQNNIRCIRNETNLGFAAAVNQGIRATRGDYVVVLNNDTVVTPGWLEQMLAHFEDDPMIGILAPLTNYANTEQKIDVDYKDEYALYRLGKKIQKQNRGKRKELRKVAGVCMIIPRNVIEEVGLFDTRFGLGNFEDDDYCVRTRMAGYRVCVALDSFIHHEGSKTFTAMNIDYEKLLERNSKIFLAKWGGVAAFREKGQKGEPGREAKRPEESNEEQEQEAKQGIEPPPPILTAILFQDGDDFSVDSIRSNLEQLPAGSDVRFICTDTGKASLMEEYSIPVVASSPDALYRTMDAEIRSSRAPFVLVLSTHATGGKGWFDEMIHVGGDREKFGILAPLSNQGPEGQKTKIDFHNADEGLDAFSKQLVEKNHNVWKQARQIGGWCVFLQKGAYIDAGGLNSEFRSAAAWADLASRLLDRGWTTGCALGSYIHYTGDHSSPAAIADRESKAVSRLAEATQFFARSDFASARSCVEEALASKGDYAQALYYRAVFNSCEGDLDSAEKDLQAARAANPTFARASNDLGCIAFERGRDKDAERYFLEAHAADPRDDDILKNLGDYYFASGASIQGMALYSKRIALDPTDPEPYFELGGWFEELGEKEGAEDWYKQVVRVAPESDSAAEAKLRLDLLEGSNGKKAENKAGSPA